MTVSDRMRAQRSRDTVPELTVRRGLHARGLRYRVNERPEMAVRRTADIVFRRARVAVFIDGCFWHVCPSHATWPKRNGDWWRSKLTRNVERDRETDELLEGAGWLVIRAWEHEDPEAVVNRVADAVESRRAN